MKIAINGSRRQSPYKEAIQRLLRNLVLGGAEIYMTQKLYSHLSGDLQLSMSGIALAAPNFAEMSDMDMVLSIGGDGTFLRTAAWVGASQTPILGINTGHLGYLAAISIDKASDFVNNIFDGIYTVEPRNLLEVSNAQVSGWPFALNEAVFTKDDSTSMILVEAFAGGKALGTYKADGLIVATPTGSTAYNLSAGGPIVEPTVPVRILTPIAAHSLAIRPMVVADNADMTVVVTGRGKSFRVIIDGRSSTLPMGSQVTIRRAPFYTNVVLPPNVSFTDVLRSKLMFNV